MENNLIVWPKSSDINHINYHYTQFGEVINYLNKKLTNNNIIGIDEDVQQENILEFIRKNNIKKVIISVNYENAFNAFKLAEEIKKNIKLPVMAYGLLTIMLKKIFLTSHFDAIHSDGDYECSIYSFIKYYEYDKEKLQGLKLIENKKFIETRKGMFINSKDWGMSSEKEVPIKAYDNIKGKNRYILNLSRGCPFSCEHCLIQLTEGKCERRRDLNNAKLALDIIGNNYKKLKIWAANFTLDKEYIYKFCEMMKNNFKNITWECATRIDLVNDLDMLKEMHNSGCNLIALGIESLTNDEFIKTKGFKLKEIDTAINNIKSQGIDVRALIMLGMPNQDKESIVNTLEYLISKNVIIRPTIYTPYHLIKDDVDLDIKVLSQYNRKTYKNTNVEGVNHKQMLELVNNPYDYKNILDLK